MRERTVGDESGGEEREETEGGSEGRGEKRG